MYCCLLTWYVLVGEDKTLSARIVYRWHEERSCRCTDVTSRPKALAVGPNQVGSGGMVKSDVTAWENSLNNSTRKSIDPHHTCSVVCRPNVLVGKNRRVTEPRPRGREWLITPVAHGHLKLLSTARGNGSYQNTRSLTFAGPMPLWDKGDGTAYNSWGPGLVRSAPVVDSCRASHGLGEIMGRAVWTNSAQFILILYRYMPTVLIVMLVNIAHHKE